MVFWNQIKDRISKTKDLAALTTSDLIGNGITAAMWLYLASIMDTQSYGELHFMLSIVGVAYLLSLFGSQTTITVYTSKNLKLESTLYSITFFGGLVSALVIALLFSRLDMSLLVFGFIINDLAIAYLIGAKEYSKYAKYILTQKFLSVILCISFYYAAGNIGIIHGLFISYLPFVVIIYKRFKETKINFAELKPRMGFVVNNYAINLSGVFRANVDKILVGSFLGLSLLGNYALASQIYTIFMTIPYIMMKYVLPDDARGSSNLKLKKLTMVIVILISVFGIFILPILIPLVLPKYTDAIELVQIMSIGIIPATLGLILSSKLLGTEKSKHVLIGRWISAITMVGGILLFGSTFGTIGLASTFVLSNTLNVVYIFISSYFKQK